MNKLFQYLSWFTILLAISTIGIFTYWLVYPYQIAKFTTPFKVINKVVSRGERVRYEVIYCKFTEVMPELTKFFVDGVIFETPKTVGVVPKGCGVVTSDAYIPKAIPEGNYKLQIVAKYKVNPIRTIEIVNYTEGFIIK